MNENKDKIEAKFDKVKGSMKEATGSLIGNKKLEAEGRKEVLKGSMKETKADMKHATKEFVDKL